jgi:general secretion pathway protein E/type IV pilus assembly protein PilB
MSQDARRDEERITERRASVLSIAYIDTTALPKQLYPELIDVAEMYKIRTIPLQADAHNLHFGITTTTSQQTITGLKNRFADHRVAFSLISDAGYSDYMKLYDPPKKVIYQNISLASDPRLQLR